MPGGFKSDGERTTAATEEVARFVIRPYILAGGRSSRMGEDKAMLMLGGMTLLARAVDTLRRSHRLRPATGQAIVTLAGERTELEGADRAIADRYPGCGPLGGMEAALRDLEGSGIEWAFFVPVDMPFLGPEAIDALLREWTEPACSGALACHAVVDKIPQPLVALVHQTLHPQILNALREGRFKVSPVLQSACAAIALERHEGMSPDYGLWRTDLSEEYGALPDQNQATDTRGQTAGTQHGLDRQRDSSNFRQFSNLNTPEDFIESESFLALQAAAEGHPAKVVRGGEDLE